MMRLGHFCHVDELNVLSLHFHLSIVGLSAVAGPHGVAGVSSVVDPTVALSMRLLAPTLLQVFLLRFWRVVGVFSYVVAA